MTSHRALQLCPQLTFIPPDFPRYRNASAEVRSALHQVTNCIEPVGMDQAFLDVTHIGKGSAGELAKDLKAKILAATGLTASMGVGPNKLVAKIASGHDRPNGLLVVSPSMVDSFLGPLPIQHLWGVGRGILARLRQLGLRTIADVQNFGRDALTNLLGGAGPEIFDWACGRDNRPVAGPPPRRRPASSDGMLVQRTPCARRRPSSGQVIALRRFESVTPSRDKKDDSIPDVVTPA